MNQSTSLGKQEQGNKPLPNNCFH